MGEGTPAQQEASERKRCPTGSSTREETEKEGMKKIGKEIKK